MPCQLIPPVSYKNQGVKTQKCHIQSPKNVIKYNYINYPIIYEFYTSEKSFSLNNILFMEGTMNI